MVRLGVPIEPPEYLAVLLRFMVVVLEFVVYCQDTAVAGGVPDTRQVIVASSPMYTVEPEPVVTVGTSVITESGSYQHFLHVKFICLSHIKYSKSRFHLNLRGKNSVLQFSD